MFEVLPGLELSQADAVARAVLADTLLHDGLICRPVCRGCGDDIDAVRLLAVPGTTRCSRCAPFPALVRRRS